MIQANLINPFEIELQETDMPSIDENQVLVKINAFGICGSDVQMYHGLHKYMTYPVVIGHEVAGEVAEVGEFVNEYKIGDSVTIQPQLTCGECYPCRVGRFNVCENLKVMGVHEDGMACEYIAITPDMLHICPDNLDNNQIAIIEPLAVAVGAVKRAGGIDGKKVAVVGAGTIGNLTAQVVLALGGEKVLITDICQEKLNVAESVGIENAVNTSNVSLKEVIDEIFGKNKADVIIDCAATKSSFEAILDAARQNSKIVITGNYKIPMQIELPIIQRQEIEIIGHMMYVKEDYENAICLISQGKIQIDNLISKVFKMSEITDAFSYIDENGTALKVIINL